MRMFRFRCDSYRSQEQVNREYDRDPQQQQRTDELQARWRRQWGRGGAHLQSDPPRLEHGRVVRQVHTADRCAGSAAVEKLLQHIFGAGEQPVAGHLPSRQGAATSAVCQAGEDGAAPSSSHTLQPGTVAWKLF